MREGFIPSGAPRCKRAESEYCCKELYQNDPCGSPSRFQSGQRYCNTQQTCIIIKYIYYKKTQKSPPRGFFYFSIRVAEAKR